MRILLKTALIASAIALTGCQHAAGSKEYTNCKVTGKDSISLKEQGHQYRVYTTCGTFVVEDSLLKGQFNSADMYGSIVQGQRYDFEAYGIRNGFLSMFPNITSIRSLD